MVCSQVDGCDIVKLDDMFEAVDKQMQTSDTHQNSGKTTEIEAGEEGNTTLTLVIHIRMFNLQHWACSNIRIWLTVVDKGVSLSLNVKNISFQQSVS